MNNNQDADRQFEALARYQYQLSAPSNLNYESAGNHNCFITPVQPSIIWAVPDRPGESSDLARSYGHGHGEPPSYFIPPETSSLDLSITPNTPVTPAGGESSNSYYGSPGLGYTGSASVSPLNFNIGGNDWPNTVWDQGAYLPGPQENRLAIQTGETCTYYMASAMSDQPAHPLPTPLAKGIKRFVPVEAQDQNQDQDQDQDRGLGIGQTHAASDSSPRSDRTASSCSSRRGTALSDSTKPPPPTKKRRASRKPTSDQSPPASSQPLGSALRTATRTIRARAEQVHTKPGESSQEQRARTTHNQVEKEYRNRLHKYFERLLDVLPDGNVAPESGPSMSSPNVGGRHGHQRRLSKAEVLDKACQRILFLESDAAKLRREREELAMALEDRKGGSAPDNLV
ncbi:hypothetical protein B0T22DRAFT_437468 [Podospora appendiculata]|uniref:BHLH domain-containing protein n=1 Tax=Podospora appendiculata TaxID=314037 RepID=A0AAE0XJ59_9PEZI|nr:hypothetical protein B0T22DRAFT_437468 [Podospora appendiculata]